MLVLTLDGGGMRGLFEAHVLEALEQALGRPITDVFDLVAGTSTGGVLALGVTVSARSPRELVELYEEHGPRIFRRTALARVRQLFVSKYRRTQLDETLRLELGEARLSSAHPRTVVPAFSLARRDIVWFDSDCRRPFPRVKVADCDPPAWQVAAATSAAPTYFEPAQVEGADGEWLDGGVGANDPTPFAMALALDERPDEVLTLSIGTGGFFPPYPKRFRGLLGIGLRSMPNLLLIQPVSWRTTPPRRSPTPTRRSASSGSHPTRAASPTTSTTRPRPRCPRCAGRQRASSRHPRCSGSSPSSATASSRPDGRQKPVDETSPICGRV